MFNILSSFLGQNEMHFAQYSCCKTVTFKAVILYFVLLVTTYSAVLSLGLCSLMVE
jgi:hypothetical protein